MLLVIAAVATILLTVFSQFGKRLPARQAFPWWCASTFLLLAVIYPAALEPLAHFLGVQLVSNLVLASMVLFLFIHLLEVSTDSLILSRKMRQMVTHRAAAAFVEKRSASNQKSSNLKALVVLPTFNEETSLPKMLEELTALPDQTKLGIAIDYCFVNDGSTDRTEALLQKSAPTHYTSHEANVNVGGVLLTGFRIAQSLDFTFMVQCDADGQHPVQSIPEILDYAHKNNVDMLIGSRFLEKSAAANHSTSVPRIAGITVIRFFLRLFGPKGSIKDPTSGFRVYSQNAMGFLAKNMPDDYPEPECIALLVEENQHLAEVYVDMSPRSHGKSSLSGLKSLRYMLKVVTALVALWVRKRARR